VISCVICAGLVSAVATPPNAEAKISCASKERLTDVPLEGLPSAPVAARTYTVVLRLPRRNAVNPEPMLMTARCSGAADSTVLPHDHGVGSAPVPGVENGAGTFAFDVRFKRSGRWRMVAMDQSGGFHDFGFLNVVPATVEPPTDATGDGLPLVAIALGVLGAGTAALIARRRGR
jgi:hypothetical protein